MSIGNVLLESGTLEAPFLQIFLICYSLLIINFYCIAVPPSIRIHPYLYEIIAANTENKNENTEKIASAACVLAAILYRTKQKYGYALQRC